MNVTRNIQIALQNRPFTNSNEPVKPFQLQKMQNNKANSVYLPDLSSTYFHPAYFHPSFRANIEQIKEFDNLLGFVTANPKKIEEKIIKKLGVLFKQNAELTSKNFINEGTEGSVYRFSDKYVFKIPEGETEISSEEFKICNNNLGNRLETYYGGKIAKVDNISILKNADPQGVAIPVGISYDSSIVENAAEYEKNVYILKLATIPQESFDKVAKDFKTLNNFTCNKENYQKYYSFDYINPNNFLLIDDKIRIVDHLEKTSDQNSNNLTRLLKVLITQLNWFIKAYFEEVLVPKRKDIFKKCILANEKSELPLNFNIYEQNILKKALDLADIKTPYAGIPDKGLPYARLPYQSLLDKLNEYRNIPNMNERLKTVEEYLDSLG